MLRKYIWVVAALLFLGVCSVPLQGGAAPPNLFIKTDKGCGDAAWFLVGEDIVFSYMLSGAAPLSEYKYWVKIYSNTGAVLSSWKGFFKTEDTGTSSIESKKSRVSFPSGVQYAEISIPSLGILTTCTFNVLSCGDHTECPNEYVNFTVSLNKTIVNPGDTVILMVDVENKTGYPFYFNSQYLEVDLGELGGVVYLFSPEIQVLSGTTRTVLAYKFSIPDVSEDEYSITIVYSESGYPATSYNPAATPYNATSYNPMATPYNSTWAACTFLNVKIKPEGIISIVSQPETLKINEEGSIVLEVTNPTLKDITYVVEAAAPAAASLAYTSYTVLVEKTSSNQITVDLSFSEEGYFTITFSLLAEEMMLNSVSTTILVEIEPEGIISIVSQPETLRINEEGSIVLEVENPTLKDITYVVEVTAPAAIRVRQTSYTLPVTHTSSKTVEVHISSSEEEGYYTLTFLLFVEERVLDTTSATILVKEPPAGSLELLFPPSTIRLKESVTLKLQIKNTSEKAITYRLSASASKGLSLPQTSWNVFVSAGDTEVLEVPVTAQGASPEYVSFELFYETTKVSSVSWNVTVEEGITEKSTNLLLAVLVLAGVAVAFMSILRYRALSQKKIPRHPEEPASQDLANIYEKAGDGSMEKGNPENAAEFYEKAGDLWRRMKNVERAVELYKKAAEIWKKLKNVGAAKRNEEKIAEAYEEAGHLSQKNSEFQKAGEFYEKAATLYRQVNNSGKSAELYELSIKMWRQIGNKEKIRENSEKAAEIYEEVGNLAQKIEELQKTGESHKIGEFFERAADLQREISTEKAAELYERAARFWEKLDNREKMKENEERIAELYERIGLDAHEAGRFQKAGIYYEKAAYLWRKMGNESRARETEEKALTAYEKANQ